MKRLLQVVVAALGVVVLLGLMVNMLAEPIEDLPAVDPAMVITMPDGEQRSLGDLVATSRTPDLATRGALVIVGESELSSDDVERSNPGAGSVATERDAGAQSLRVVPGKALDADEIRAMIDRYRRERWKDGPPDGSDLYALAEYEHDFGRVEQALALYRSVPEDHPDYARAQRQIGWRIYTRELGDPRRGVAFVNRSVRTDPFDGNGWQDLYRVYANGLGIPVH